LVVFHKTAEAAVKFVPMMVIVKAAPPEIAEAGVRLVMVGGCGKMVKTAPEERPPIVRTVMLAAPIPAIMLAGIAAVSCVEFKIVAGSMHPFHIKTEARVKFAPLMVSVKAAPPATAMDGLKLSSIGGGGWRRVKAAAEEFPLRSLTNMLTVPALALRAAGTVAPNCSALT